MPLEGEEGDLDAGEEDEERGGIQTSPAPYPGHMRHEATNIRLDQKISSKGEKRGGTSGRRF